MNIIKNILAILFFSLLTAIPLCSQDISGYWQGVIYQNGSPTIYFPYIVQLSQNGNTINGTTVTKMPDGTPYFVNHSLFATINNNLFSFQTRITSQLPPPGGNWCPQEGTLTYSSASETLTGPWIAGLCSEPGIIELWRLKVISDTVFCKGQPVSLSVTGQNIKWYSNSNLTALESSGNNFSPNIDTTTTYYITQTHFNTESPAIAIRIRIKPQSFATFNQTICEGQTYFGHTTSGTYKDTIVAANGCDSIRTLNLTVKPKSFSTINQSICEGQTYLGHNISGTYIDLFVAANGCDSTRTLNLTVKLKSFSTISQSICERQTYSGHNTAGIYIDTFAAANGCDSICTLNLTVKPKSISTVSQSICEGQIYLGHSISGTYIDTLVAANGCDSIRTLNLIVKPKSFSTINQSICQGQIYSGYNITGTYIDTFISANGCDSIRTLNLTVRSNSRSTVTTSICQGQTYSGHNVSGIYVDTLTAASGCDSIRTLNLIVKSNSRSTVSTSICQGQIYSGYNASGIYIDTLTAANGCDSIRTLHLTVYPGISTTIDTTICYGNNVEGHYTSGTYRDIYKSVHGCDSIRITRLTVLPLPNPSLGADASVCPGDSVILDPGNFFTYRWQDGSTKKQFVVKQPGVYSVNVTGGCGAATAKIVVTAKTCDLYFPTGFTPNNDGKNDVFKILNAGNLQEYHLSIYNRWGQKIFETEDYKKGWDGKLHGKDLDPDTFIWRCKLIRSNVVTYMNGFLTLIR